VSFDADEMVRTLILHRLRERPSQDVAELVASVGVPWSDIEAALDKLVGFGQVEVVDDASEGEKVYRLSPSRLRS
jgi:hypothetical protein